MSILESASKIVFILMALAVITGLFAGEISGDQFLVLAGMAFAFYFSKPNDMSLPK